MTQKRDYIDFQERSVARGYLITFRCYGTWLHGDERGSVDRRYYNRYGEPRISPNAEQEKREASLLSTPPITLDAEKRVVVDAAIREVCSVRNYRLYALNIRTNHAHVVVSNSDTPERMLTAFKAYATRAMRNKGLIETDEKPWSRHGSTRYLWTEEHIAAAVDYVVNGQGGELPKFE